MASIEILSAIVEAVLGYVLDQSGLADWARRKLGREPTHLALRHALGRAAAAFEAQHPDWAPSLLGSGFLQGEGRPVLAQFLVRDGRPAPSELAERWADYLHVHDPRGRAVYARVLEPVAADFLESLSHALKAEPELSDLCDSQALESLAADVAAIRRHLGADQATPGTRRDYLHWLIERNLYLDPRGTFQTQRQVQVKLDEVYISLRAQQEETPGAVDRRLMERELAELEARLAEDRLPAEEAEDRREQLLARFERPGLDADAGQAGQVVELAEAAGHHDRLVVLGDPGSGKTTLLRYLALQHAQALWDGRSQVGPGGELGPACLPILIRIADYAENGTWKGKPLSDFLSEHCAVHECPGDGLADLLARALAAGDCLALLDGLDEIVDADDRRGIVGRIEDFVRRYDDRPNRFVVTSRVAGYRSALLSAPFAHYMVQEMDDAQIRRFLERWCPAVEAAQTPDLSPEARQATARREIDGIMRAVEGSAGVRRLAANPLMLRTLALIHRTGAQLPQKRIELYKLAADTLARTWRPAQGVPELALVEEQHLTRLLGRLAYWIHLRKPAGIATEREVYAVLGAEWARIHHLEWDEDDPNPEILAQVDTFLRAVREHTGLFVERAPRRYGFMHLTFEEYYAARHLVARRRNAAPTIRGHLHDPRWDEPILLALGFVGLDYPEEAAELLETAILAQGEEAQELGFHPSPYEEILGRDYLFALRCLGDRIPADRRLVQRLVERLADETLHETGSVRFQHYRQALGEGLSRLAGSDAAMTLIPSLTGALDDDDAAVCARAAEGLVQLGQASPKVVAALLRALGDDQADVHSRAVWSLGRLGQASPEGVAALLHALDDDTADVRYGAAVSLGQLGQASPEVVAALVRALDDDDAAVRSRAARSLGQLEQTPPEGVAALVRALGDDAADVRSLATRSLGQLRSAPPEVAAALVYALDDDAADVRFRAAESLGHLGQASTEVAAALVRALGDDYAVVRTFAVESLVQLGQASPEVTAALAHALDDDTAAVRTGAAESLVQLGQASPEVTAALVRALDDDDWRVRTRAAESLVQLGQASPEGVTALVRALGDDDWRMRSLAAESLVQLRSASPEVIAALLRALDDDETDVRYGAAVSLGQLGQVSPKILDILVGALRDACFVSTRQNAARLLGRIGHDDEALIFGLWCGLKDRDNEVRTACARALATLGRRFPGAAEGIAQKLAQAIADPAFDEPARYEKRTGHDYAFDGLWLLTTGSPPQHA